MLTFHLLPLDHPGAKIFFFSKGTMIICVALCINANIIDEVSR